MCGRYSFVARAEQVAERFNVKVDASRWHNNVNIAPGDSSAVITNEKPKEIQWFVFGLTPHWAKKPMYLFNARTEGDENQDNQPDYQGKKGIVDKPAFKKSIRNRRCLILADYFIEGTTKEKLDRPFRVEMKDSSQHPFAMAGLWDEWVNLETGELLSSFAIITTVSNSLLQKLPHHRSPVVLKKEDEPAWLESDDLKEVLNLLQPFPGELLCAYPISPSIKNPHNKDLALIEPIGEAIF